MADAIAPFFSVVVPVYNRAQVLARTLRSILAQSEQDFEIIVVDDGSTDDPQRVMNAIADPRIRLVRRENGGGGAARNTGIDLARGRFIAPLDSDDEFLPHHLETMRGLLQDTTDTVGYGRVLVDRGGSRIFVKPPRAIGPGEHMATYLMCDRGFVPTITVVVPTELAKHVRYHENLRCSEDSDFALRLYLAGAKFVMAEPPGGIWHDVYDPGRAAAGRDVLYLIPWLEKLRPQIPPAAYYGCRGWKIAKGVVTRDVFEALRLYLTALGHGCYRPRLAAVVFTQIFMPDRAYRRLADLVVALRKIGRRPAPAPIPNADRAC